MAFLFLTFLILALAQGYKAEDACFRVVGRVNCGSTEYVPVKVELYDEDDNGKWSRSIPFVKASLEIIRVRHYSHLRICIFMEWMREWNLFKLANPSIYQLILTHEGLVWVKNVGQA